jgi:hypothetical protein
VNSVDSQSRAFFSCVVFDVASNASGLFVVESPTGAEGSFYYNIPEVGRPFTVVEDNSPLVLHDKDWIAADRYASSPNRDNVYVTWTVFKFGPDCLGGSDTAPAFCESPIFGAMSTDHGQTWSKPQEISGTSPALCSFGNFFSPTAGANDCNFDQGSNPVVLPNGDLEVAFNNGNTPAGDPNAQQLAVHCHPTGDSVAGTANLNCAPPVKVGDDFLVGEPQCDFGCGPEECIPGAYIRTNDYPRITTENTQNNHLYVTWQDYRNSEYDIQLAESTDGGLTWSELGTVNPDTGLDHYFAATDQSPQQGDQIGVSYYRTARVPNENTTPRGGFAPCSGNGRGEHRRVDGVPARRRSRELRLRVERRHRPRVDHRPGELVATADSVRLQGDLTGLRPAGRHPERVQRRLQRDHDQQGAAGPLVRHAQRRSVPRERRLARRGHLHGQRGPAERQGQAGPRDDRQGLIAPDRGPAAGAPPTSRRYARARISARRRRERLARTVCAAFVASTRGRGSR